jgi:hypothetical protein
VEVKTRVPFGIGSNGVGAQGSEGVDIAGSNGIGILAKGLDTVGEEMASRKIKVITDNKHA